MAEEQGEPTALHRWRKVLSPQSASRGKWSTLSHAHLVSNTTGKLPREQAIARPAILTTVTEHTGNTKLLYNYNAEKGKSARSPAPHPNRRPGCADDDE